MVDRHSSRQYRGGSPTSLPSTSFLPYDTQHALLNTVQRMLEESCFDFAKKWFPNDYRVRLWTTPTQVEISKWRDILGVANIPPEALDTTDYTPLKLLLQEATYIRNNAVHRSPVLVDLVLKMLSSAVQLTRMLRDQTRQLKIQKLLDHLKDELCTRIKNMARVTEKYGDIVEDIDRRKEPMLRQLDILAVEKGTAMKKFEQDALRHDTLLQNSMTRFINLVIHAGEAVDNAGRTLPRSHKETSAYRSQSIEKGSNAVAVEPHSASLIHTELVANTAINGKDDDVQFISRYEFDEVTLLSRQLQKKVEGGANEPRANKSGERKVLPEQDSAKCLFKPSSLQRPLQSLSSRESNMAPGQARSTTSGLQKLKEGHIDKEDKKHLVHNSDCDADESLFFDVQHCEENALIVKTVQPQANSTTKLTESCHKQVDSCIIAKDANEIHDKPAMDVAVNNESNSATNLADCVSIPANSDTKASGPPVQYNQVHLKMSLDLPTIDDEEDRAGSSSDVPILRALRVETYQPDTELESNDSPSRQLEFEANMTNNVLDLCTDEEYDVLRNLEAELESQLKETMDEAFESTDWLTSQIDVDIKPSIEIPVVPATSDISDLQDGTESDGSRIEPGAFGRRAPSPELKMTGRSLAPSPNEEISRVEVSNGSADSPGIQRSCNMAGSSIAEFGKPWQPITNRLTLITSAGETQQENGSKILYGQKRKKGSPLSNKSSIPCNSLNQSHVQPVFGGSSFPICMGLNAPKRQFNPSSTAPVSFLFGNTSTSVKTTGSDPANSLFSVTSKVHNTVSSVDMFPNTLDLDASRKIATSEGRRLLVGQLSFTPSKAEVEKLFLGYNVTRIDFPELEMPTSDQRPAGHVFVDMLSAEQAQLAIQMIHGGKIRKCKISVQLASEPWKKAKLKLSQQGGSKRPNDRKQFQLRQASATSFALGGSGIRQGKEAKGVMACPSLTKTQETIMTDDHSSKRLKITAETYRVTGGHIGNGKV